MNGCELNICIQCAKKMIVVSSGHDIVCYRCGSKWDVNFMSFNFDTSFVQDIYYTILGYRVLMTMITNDLKQKLRNQHAIKAYNDPSMSKLATIRKITHNMDIMRITTCPQCSKKIMTCASKDNDDVVSCYNCNVVSLNGNVILRDEDITTIAHKLFSMRIEFNQRRHNVLTTISGIENELCAATVSQHDIKRIIANTK